MRTFPDQPESSSSLRPVRDFHYKTAFILLCAMNKHRQSHFIRETTIFLFSSSREDFGIFSIACFGGILFYGKMKFETLPKILFIQVVQWFFWNEFKLAIFN